MSDKWVWFFAITGFILSILNNIIGIWDLIIDMRDLKQDANSLRPTDVSEEDNDATQKRK